VQKRHFKLEIGLLKKAVAVSGIARPRLDPQDEFHYYHIDVPANSTDLVFELVPERTTDLDLLVRYAKAPEFDYATYRGKTIDDVAEGTQVGKSAAGVTERIAIKNPPKAGTYFVVVVPSLEDNQENMSYTLTATFGHKVPSSSGGCVLGTDERFDPVLPLLVTIAALGIAGSRLRRQKGS